jgi:hypothetical protein
MLDLPEQTLCTSEGNFHERDLNEAVSAADAPRASQSTLPSG